MTLAAPRRLVSRLFARSLATPSTPRFHASVSIGLLIALLPTAEVQVPLLGVVAVAFRLHLLLLFAGATLIHLLPVAHLAAHWAGRQVDAALPPFTAGLLSLSGYLQEPVRNAAYLVGCAAIAGIASMILLPATLTVQRLRQRLRAGRARGFQVFRDPTGDRAVLVRRTARVAIPIAAVIAATFGVALAQAPALPSLELAPVGPYAAFEPVEEATVPSEQVAELRERVPLETDRAGGRSVGAGLVFAFYVPWDPTSEVSLRRNLASIDVVIPEWFHLTRDMRITDDRQPHIDALLEQSDVLVLPSISNLIDGAWNREVVASLISSPAKTHGFISRLLEVLGSGPYDGINIDFENLRAADRNAYRSFITEVSTRLHAAGHLVTLDLTVGEPENYDYHGLVAAADYAVIMLYDEHYSTGSPGPLASQPWFEAKLSALAGLPAEKVVIGLGNYGYDWNASRSRPATSLTVADAYEIAREGGLDISWDAASGSPHYSYRDGSEVHHVWFLDAASAYNQLSQASAAGFANVGLWVLGSEDPSIWPVLDHGPSAEALAGLTRVGTHDAVRHIGSGEVLHVASTPSDGVRRVVVRDRRIVDETYDTLPVPYRMARLGAADEKQVVLTFDDGPDRRYTPQVLDILRRYQVPATFFVIGLNAVKHPDLVHRIAAEGHEVGVHTFSHPDVRQVSEWQYGLELSLTQRIVQHLTGRSTLLFRPPAGIDLYNPSPEEYLPILRAQGHGYTVVGEMIDPKDWATGSAQEIHRRVLADAGRGGVILLHDSGGDRAPTLAALPRIIEDLQARGYRFTTVSQLLGRTRSELMPPVAPQEGPAILYNQGAVEVAGVAAAAVGVLFFLATGLGFARFGFLMVFSRRHARRPIIRGGSGGSPGVSVVIAAYNERDVICRTVTSILAGDHPLTDVIVVDDGSTDGTAEAIRAAFGADPRVRLLQQRNAGKAAAVNRGFSEAAGQIVVACDADTVLSPTAIGLLVSHFDDPTVAAVSGNIKVGNVTNLLTRWQHIEYVVGFNLERRAFSELNAVTVVPGALGAWRRAAVMASGGFQEDTLAEDTDLTLALLRDGHRVSYEPHALAFTEAPADLPSLLKQRYRWTYGTLQCLWKHRDLLFSREKRALGWVALPSMWVFQFGFQMLAPLADVIFLAGLFGGAPASVLLFYALFLIVDYLAAWHAFRLEGERPGVLGWLFLQRIIYRLIIMLVILRTILAAIRGIPVGWNKLLRRGDVQVGNVEPVGVGGRG